MFKNFTIYANEAKCNNDVILKSAYTDLYDDFERLRTLAVRTWGELTRLRIFIHLILF